MRTVAMMTREDDGDQFVGLGLDGGGEFAGVCGVFEFDGEDGGDRGGDDAAWGQSGEEEAFAEGELVGEDGGEEDGGGTGEEDEAGDEDGAEGGGGDAAGEEDEEEGDDEDAEVFLEGENFADRDGFLVGEGDAEDGDGEEAGLLLDGIGGGEGGADHGEEEDAFEEIGDEVVAEEEFDALGHDHGEDHAD